jgi:ribonuclease HI
MTLEGSMSRRRSYARTDERAAKYAESIGSYIAYFDGCCEPRNPGGTAGYGVVIFKNGERIWQHSGMIPASPTTSNNVAEYLAFNAILDWFIAADLTNEPILVKGDSNLVIQQCFGTWKIKKGFYIEHARAAREKVKKFRALRGTWIRRDLNSLADELSKAELHKVGVVFKIQPEAA